MHEQLKAIAADLEELASRGFGHNDAPQIVGRMRVAMQQISDLAGAPVPPADPVAVQVGNMAAAVAALADAVPAVIQRQKDTQAALAGFAGLVQDLANKVGANAAAVEKLATGKP